MVSFTRFEFPFYFLLFSYVFVTDLLRRVIGLEPFLDTVSSFNVFNSLIYVLKYKIITVPNQINFSFHCKKNELNLGKEEYLISNYYFHLYLRVVAKSESFPHFII